MIRTITLNTGFDETVVVSDIDFGGVGALLSRESVPSGKGVNAGRVVRALGGDVVVYGLVGQADVRQFQALIAVEGVESRLVAVDASTRRNLTLVSRSSAEPAAHFRADGFSFTDATPVEQLIGLLRTDIRVGDIVSLHGSTPDGLDAGTWTRFAALARRQGARVVADIYGPALRHLLSSVPVTICKPNEHEIQGLADVGKEKQRDAVAAALRLMCSHGVQMPVVTLGADGLMFAFGDELWQAALTPSAARISVAAGDACAAGMLVALQTGTEPGFEVIRHGIAAAVAHVEETPLHEFVARTNDLLQSVRFGRPEGLLTDAGARSGPG